MTLDNWINNGSNVPLGMLSEKKKTTIRSFSLSLFPSYTFNTLEKSLGGLLPVTNPTSELTFSKNVTRRLMARDGTVTRRERARLESWRSERSSRGRTVGGEPSTDGGRRKRGCGSTRCTRRRRRSKGRDYRPPEPSFLAATLPAPRSSPKLSRDLPESEHEPLRGCDSHFIHYRRCERDF